MRPNGNEEMQSRLVELTEWRFMIKYKWKMMSSQGEYGKIINMSLFLKFLE